MVDLASGSEYSGLRITGMTVGAGIGVQVETDISRIKSITVIEMTRHGTSVGDVSVKLGDMGDPFDISPGDCISGFFPVKRLTLINNTATAKKVVLALHESENFRWTNNPRGV